MLYIICIQKFNCFNCLYIYIYIYIYKKGHPLAPKILKIPLSVGCPPTFDQKFHLRFHFYEHNYNLSEKACRLLEVLLQYKAISSRGKNQW